MNDRSSSGAARYLTVGALAARSGVSVSAIHFYERKGLIHSTRDAANHRLFPRNTLRVLAIIRVGQHAGLKLGEIRKHLGPAAEGATLKNADWERISAEWRDELIEKIAALTRLKNRLTGCIGCGCLSMTQCPAVNPDDVAGRDGPGAPGLDGRM